MRKSGIPRGKTRENAGEGGKSRDHPHAEQIDRAIDRCIQAKWDAEESIAANHARRTVQWKQVKISEVPIGCWVYDILKAPAGTYAGMDAKKNWIVASPRGPIVCNRDIPVFIKEGYTKTVCTCETCAGVEERRIFMAGR